MGVTSSIFSKFERDELNKITAKSILEKLMNIRQHINIGFIARRLVWELIQNAKDNVSLCNEINERVDITIRITENEFIFCHNKGYFTNEHIRGLIRKYSSSDKERDEEHLGHKYRTTGRFGTGFMTTHLLSEKVKVESFYKHENGSYSPFSFWLDRSGRSEAKIIEGINTAFQQAEESIGNSTPVSLLKQNFKTSFIYPLADKKSELANLALEEVYRGVAYTLINVPEVRSIAIDEELIGELIYSVELIDTFFYNESPILLYKLLINGDSSEKYFMSMEEEKARIIVPVAILTDQYHTVELEKNIPRLHLDFPMIGTEDLNLPFIVNSTLFEPTEPRDGISLIDDEQNEISHMNCNIVRQATGLFNKLLEYIGQQANWNDLYNLARIKPPRKHPWIDDEWFKTEVVDVIREKLLYSPLVEVVNGNRISIWNENGESNVYFPFAEKAIIREKIWELASILFPASIPVKAHIDKWNEIVWEDCYKFELSTLSTEIQSLATLDGLAAAINSDEDGAITYLNEYYKLLDQEGKLIKDILADEYRVIPNQFGEFKKKSELFVDKGIDEQIKAACSIVSRDPREYLIMKRISTGSNILYGAKKQENIVAEMNEIIKAGKNTNIAGLCDYLVTLFPEDEYPDKRNLIFEFSKRIYPDDIKEARTLSQHDEKIWEESDSKSIGYIVAKISESKSVEKAVENFAFESSQSFVEWLNSFISFLVKEGFQNKLTIEKYPILPNQNGIFTAKEKLFLDEDDIGDELKDIAQELGHDFRDELLDRSIFLELPENRRYSIVNVAEKIAAFLKPILRDVDKRKNHREILKRFYVWMNENKLKADQYFSDLFEKRFLFLEDDDISNNIKKATEFDQLLEEHGINGIEELRDKLSQMQSKDSSEAESQKIPITKEILASLGITSQKEFDEAFKNPEISSRFFHVSTPSIDMYVYAQSLIQRAKENIINHLRNHSDYDCMDMEETAPTTLVGILKNGLPVQIVTRPSDHGEVIIFYSSEKDTLDTDNSELWIENGITEPHILTLGRILKSTGINRIPIKMN